MRIKNNRIVLFWRNAKHFIFAEKQGAAIPSPRYKIFRTDLSLLQDLLQTSSHFDQQKKVYLQKNLESHLFVFELIQLDYKMVLQQLQWRVQLDKLSV